MGGRGPLFSEDHAAEARAGEDRAKRRRGDGGAEDARPRTSGFRTSASEPGTLDPRIPPHQCDDVAEELVRCAAGVVARSESPL